MVAGTGAFSGNSAKRADYDDDNSEGGDGGTPTRGLSGPSLIVPEQSAESRIADDSLARI
jgi:hypothetical protein